MKKLLFVFLCIIISNSLYAQYVPTNGLIAYYPFNGNANDSSGHNYNMTVSNATPMMNRYFQTNKAYKFNGVNSLIFYNDTLPLTGNCTWSFWTQIDTFQNAALVYNGNTNSNGYGFAINSGLFPAQGSYGDKITFLSGGINYNISVPYLIGKWHHVVLTKSGNKFKLYLDKVLQDSSTNTFNTPNGKFHIGLDYTNNTNPFKGGVDDIVIYNRVLTPLEIDTLYQQCGKQITTQPTNVTSLAGSTATFSAITPFSPILYQWQENAGNGFVNLSNTAPYSGVNTNTLTINPTTAAMNNNQYRLIVMNDINCKDTSGAVTYIVVPTAIDNILSHDLVSVYPNPSPGDVFIDLSNFKTSQNISIKIFDVLGRTIINQQNKLFNAPIRINLSTQGIYFLNVYTQENGLIHKQKIIIN